MFRLSILAIASQNVWICVNIPTALSIVLANVHCADSSIPRIFIFYPFIIFYLIFTPCILRFHILYLRNSVTWFVLVLTWLFRFWNNIVVIHNNLNRGNCHLIFLFVYPTSTWSGQPKHVVVYNSRIVSWIYTLCFVWLWTTCCETHIWTRSPKVTIAEIE